MKKEPTKTIGLTFNCTSIMMILFLCLFLLAAPAAAQGLSFDRYHNPGEVNKIMLAWVNANSSIAKLHKLAVTPGGKKIFMLEIGPEKGKKKKTLPAILVVANLDGQTPIAVEATLYLTKMILDKAELRKDKTWYILPSGNPDAAQRYFEKIRRRDARNLKPYNDDMDDRTDEDGVEDLDGNQIITMMRIKDPEGQWLPVPGEPRLMKKADWTKGEKGIYKLYTEGIDNDKDGKYNEDGPGGANIAVNFPHLFKFFTKSAGRWAGSEDESYSLFKFVFQHPEIAMTLYFGDSNFCMIPPKGGRKGEADFSSIKVPKGIAERMGFDPNKKYSMDEIMEKAQQIAPPDFKLTRNIVASFLGLGAAVNPQAPDLKFYNAISEDFKEFLKKNKMDGKRLEPAAAKDGSFPLWAYYHLGIPSFSMDFWTLPQLKKEKKGPDITPEKLEKMSKEDFLALGEEKIAAFLKASGAPGNIKAKMVINMVKNGMMTTKKMAQMMKQMSKPKSKGGADPTEKALLAFNDKELKGNGFIDWKPFDHPTLGQVEIGGIVPFATTTPPTGMIEKLLKGQVPWTFELVKRLSHIKIAKTHVDFLGSGVYRVKAWIENSGAIPYPTAMGKRNRRITPVIVSLKGTGMQIMEGKKRSLIESIGSLGTEMVQWVVKMKKPGKLQVTAHTATSWSDSTQVVLNSK
jgi:Zinc carboxypeptidase